MSFWDDFVNFFTWSFRTDYQDTVPGGSDWEKTTDWLDTDVFPYTPGLKEKQMMDDEARYWNDYRKNTGFRPRYPGKAIHAPDVGDLLGTWDWWRIS